MVMRHLREGAFSGFLKYVIFTFIGLSIVGLVLLDVGNSFRNNVSGNRDIAVVEGKTIELADFDQTLRRTLQQTGLSPQQAYQAGYVEEILTQEIRGHLALVEAEKLGINIGAAQVKESIAKAVKPIVQEGQTLQQAFEQALQERRISEKQFVKGVKKELASDAVVQTAEKGFFGASAQLAEDILSFQAQTRDVDVIIFPHDDVTGIKDATEEQLKNLYESLKGSRFKIPEYRSAKIGIYQADSNEKPIEISDKELQEYYDQNTKTFEVGEQKVITQALMTSEEPAKKILTLTDSGRTLEDAYKEVEGAEARALTPNMRLEASMMFPEMRQVLEKAKNGQVVGPIKTPLGFHVLRLDSTIPPMIRPFDEVKEALRKQMTDEKKMQKISDIAAALEDHFMNGGKVDDAKSITALKIVDLLAIDGVGNTRENKDGFAGVDEKAASAKVDILKTLFEIAPDDVDHARIISTMDSAFLVVELGTIEPESFKPYESVREDIQKQFENDQKADLNKEKMDEFVKSIQLGTTDFERLAKDQKKTIKAIDGVTVGGPLTEPLNEEMRPSIFKEKIGDILPFTTENESVLVKIKGFKLPPLTEEQKAQLETITKNLDTEMKQESVMMYLEALSRKYVAKVNDTLLQRAYGAQSQTGAP